MHTLTISRGTCQKQLEEFNAVTRTVVGKSNTMLILSYFLRGFPINEKRDSRALEQEGYRHEKHCNTGFAGKAH